MNATERYTGIFQDELNKMAARDAEPKKSDEYIEEDPENPQKVPKKPEKLLTTGATAAYLEERNRMMDEMFSNSGEARSNARATVEQAFGKQEYESGAPVLEKDAHKTLSARVKDLL